MRTTTYYVHDKTGVIVSALNENFDFGRKYVLRSVVRDKDGVSLFMYSLRFTHEHNFHDFIVNTLKEIY